MVKTLEDMKKEKEFYWTCSFCGYSKNEGTESICAKCGGVRTTA
jgi:rubrerythrin